MGNSMRLSFLGCCIVVVTCTCFGATYDVDDKTYTNVVGGVTNVVTHDIEWAVSSVSSNSGGEIVFYDGKKRVYGTPITITSEGKVEIYGGSETNTYFHSLTINAAGGTKLRRFTAYDLTLSGGDCELMYCCNVSNSLDAANVKMNMNTCKVDDGAVGAESTLKWITGSQMTLKGDRSSVDSSTFSEMYVEGEECTLSWVDGLTKLMATNSYKGELSMTYCSALEGAYFNIYDPRKLGVSFAGTNQSSVTIQYLEDDFKVTGLSWTNVDVHFLGDAGIACVEKSSFHQLTASEINSFVFDELTVAAGMTISCNVGYYSVRDSFLSGGVTLTGPGNDNDDPIIVQGCTFSNGTLGISDAPGCYVADNYFGINEAGQPFANGSGLGIFDCEKAIISENVVLGGGIWLDRSSQSRITDNQVGTYLNQAYTSSGIRLEDSCYVLVGGTNDGRNVVVGSYDSGIKLVGDCSDAGIYGNYIGVLPNGGAGGNVGDGIQISEGSDRVWVGSYMDEGTRNIISCNGKRGILSYADELHVHYNYIGTGTNGSGDDMGNGSDGIYLDAPNNCQIGLPEGRGNVISGNGGCGIYVFRNFDLVNTEHCSSNGIANNYIGTDYQGANLIPNASNGISFVTEGGSNVMENCIEDGNVIAANGHHGIYADAHNLSINGNYIGITKYDQGSGTDAGNGVAGVVLALGSSSNVVTDNTICDNSSDGIWMRGSHHTISDNKIGVGWAGNQVPHGNFSNGIFMNASDCWIVGNDVANNEHNGISVVRTEAYVTRSNYLGRADARNTIHDNKGYEIYVSNAPVVIAANTIGLDDYRYGELGSYWNTAIEIESDNVTIGGTNATDGNLVIDLVGIHVGQGYTNVNIRNNAFGFAPRWPASLSAYTNESTMDTAIDCRGGDGYVIADNSFGGIRSNSIALYSPTNFTVSGNVIGYPATEYGLNFTNAAHGIHIVDGFGVQVGTLGDGNQICGNGGHGIWFERTFTNTHPDAGCTFMCNTIGVQTNGTCRPNNGHGLLLQAPGLKDHVGGTVHQGNDIAGNKRDGIHVDGGYGLRLEGNRVGLSLTGDLAMGNAGHGLFLLDTVAAQIGSTSNDGVYFNTLSGNAGCGILIINTSEHPERSASIYGAVVGLDIFTAAKVPNGSHGVAIYNAPNIRFAAGGDDDATLVGGNGGHGIYIHGAGSSGCSIKQTWIGAGQFSGVNVAVGNEGDGIRVEDAAGLQIGGTGVDFGTVSICDNGGHGIHLMGNVVDSSVVEGCLIGITTNKVFGNRDNGIQVSMNNVRVGGTSSNAMNVICGNQNNGIAVANTRDITLQHNRIGVNYATATNGGNGANGIIYAYSHNGSVVDNVLVNNAENGLLMEGTNAVNNLLQNNYVGLLPDGEPAGNTLDGIYLKKVNDQYIGDTPSLNGGNMVSFNRNGIVIDEGIRNRIVGNVVVSNQLNGIRLINGGNNNLSAPQLFTAWTNATGVAIKFTATADTTGNHRFLFYQNSSTNASGRAEGEISLGEVATPMNAGQPITATVTLSSNVPLGVFVTAVLVDPNQNTSEFSNPVLVESTEQTDGLLEVTLLPEAAASECRWRLLSTGGWHYSGQTQGGLASGQYVVTFDGNDQWIAPADSNVTVVAGYTTPLNATFTANPYAAFDLLGADGTSVGSGAAIQEGNGTDYGVVAPGQSVTHQFTVTNSSAVALTISGVITNGNTEFGLALSSAVVPANSSMDVPVTFMPQQAGSPVTEFVFTMHATNSPYTLRVGGTVPAKPTVGAVQSVSVDQDAFETMSSVTANGGSPVWKRGICWALHSTPTTSDWLTQDGTGVGDFSSVARALAKGTTYYVRPYAINDAGTSYGSEISITTSNKAPTPPDIDYVWNGSEDTYWTNGANWSGGGVPGSTNTAVFYAEGATNVSVELEGTQYVGSVVVNENAALGVLFTDGVLAMTNAGSGLTIQTGLVAFGETLLLGENCVISNKQGSMVSLFDGLQSSGSLTKKDKGDIGLFSGVTRVGGDFNMRAGTYYSEDGVYLTGTGKMVVGTCATLWPTKVGSPSFRTLTITNEVAGSVALNVEGSFKTIIRNNDHSSIDLGQNVMVLGSNSVLDLTVIMGDINITSTYTIATYAGLSGQFGQINGVTAHTVNYGMNSLTLEPTFVWDGAVNTNWNQSGNWTNSAGAVPGATNDAGFIVSGGGNVRVNVDTNPVVRSVRAVGDGTVELVGKGRTIMLTNAAVRNGESPAVVAQDGMIFVIRCAIDTVPGARINAAQTFFDTIIRLEGAVGSEPGRGNLILDGGGRVELLGTNTFGSSTNWLEINGASLFVNGDSALGNPDAGIIFTNGGSLSVSNDLTSGRRILFGGDGTIGSGSSGTTVTMTNVIAGSGVMTISGDGTVILTASNLLGGAEVEGGALRIMGHLRADGTVGISSNAVLGGRGTIQLGSSEYVVHIRYGASCAPGASVGTITVDGSMTVDGALDIEVENNSNDVLAVRDALTLGSVSVLNVVGAADGVSDYEFATFASRIGVFGGYNIPKEYTLSYGTTNMVLVAGGEILSSTNVTHAGSNIAIALSIDSNTAWTAVSTSSWITVASGTTGQGDGTCQLTIASNEGRRRCGTVWIAGMKFNITQQSSKAVYLDFDGDGKADVTCYNPEDGTWYILKSATMAAYVQPWGWADSVPVAGDYDGDGKYDTAVYDDTYGTWFILQSATMTSRQQSWGAEGMMAVPADYDGDGITDVAVYEQESGTWLILQSETATARSQPWGFDHAVPVPGDYDGDGKADVAVYWPEGGQWYILQSSDGQAYTQPWGWADTEACQGDFDGDGRTDVAVYWPATGWWNVLQSSDGQQNTQNWGWNDTISVPADYDGDGKYDVTVYAPIEGLWYIWQSTTLDSRVQAWGWKSAGPVNQQFWLNSWE